MNIDILSQLKQLSSSGGFAIIDNLGSYVSNIVGLIFIIAGLATFFYLVWGGIRWLTAGPDKNKAEEARTQLTNAIIGLAIVAASWAVFLILNYFFGLNLAQPNTPQGGGRNIQFTPQGGGRNITGP